MTTKSLRAYHSFWSKPLLQRRFDRSVASQLPSTLLFTAIGVTAAKRLGLEIVLHTDDWGAKLLEVLPYDEIYLTLNGHDIHRNFWASGKFAAHEREPLGSCHLDMDAWVKKPLCRDIIAGCEADALFEHAENRPHCYRHELDFLFGAVDSVPHLDLGRTNGVWAYNCGLVRLNSQKLKDMWLEGYRHIARELDKKNPPGLDGHWRIPDIAAEQWLVYQLCEQHDFTAQCLFAGSFQDVPVKIGYTHLITEGKYMVNGKLESILQSLDAGLYRRVRAQIQQYTSEEGVR